MKNLIHLCFLFEISILYRYCLSDLSLASIGILDLSDIGCQLSPIFVSPVNEYRLSLIRFFIISYRVSVIRFSVIVPNYVKVCIKNVA